MVVSDSIILRLKGPLELKCQLDSTKVQHIQSRINKSFEDLNSKVKSDSFVLNVCNSPVFIWPNKNVYAKPDNITADTLCMDLLHFQTDQESNSRKSGKRKEKKKSVINMNLMTEVTEPVLISAPVLLRSTKNHFIHTVLPLDCVVTVPTDETLKIACGRLMKALSSQLCDMQTVTLRHMKETVLLVPQAFHFLLPKPTGLVTVIYPAGVPDSQLEVVRKELHHRYELPDDKPYLKRANAFHFPDEPYKDGYIRNPHVNLNHPALENGKLYLVQGVYCYHHYMQDHMDDNGWGCAYRSLQTICSWFLYQGYVEQAVPTHKEIQRALVAVGDKQDSFVGSCQWIGSIEVQAVLNQLLGVTSKIMFVSQGSELASKGRELANHFLEEGTPVMIGGGVLAHTILGVSWSETSGQIRFLILDPHYTGAEDLQVITDKGWCGWKGPEFWDQYAYYNLCLPMRPKTI